MSSSFKATTCCRGSNLIDSRWENDRGYLSGRDVASSVTDRIRHFIIASSSDQCEQVWAGESRAAGRRFETTERCLLLKNPRSRAITTEMIAITFDLDPNCKDFSHESTGNHVDRKGAFVTMNILTLAFHC